VTIYNASGNALIRPQTVAYQNKMLFFSSSSLSASYEKSRRDIFGIKIPQEVHYVPGGCFIKAA